jgi:hypothetical protein
LPYLLSGALLAAASLVKLFPLALSPLLFTLVPAERRMHFVAGFIAALVVLILPFFPHIANITATLDVYARNWEFSGFLFNTLRIATGSGTTARMVLSAGFLFLVAILTFRAAGKVRGERSKAGRHVMVACYAIAMAFLLLTPTMHPWYALSLAVFLPFAAGPAGLVLCWAVFLTYRVQIGYFMLGEWSENPWVTAAVFLAPVAAFVLSRLFRGIGRRRIR